MNKNIKTKGGNAKSIMKESNANQNVCKGIKYYKITEEQLSTLFEELTNNPAYEISLCKVKINDEQGFEFESAKEDFFLEDEETYKKEYEMLRNSCGKDEIEIFKYTPFTIHQMLESIEKDFNSYEKENQEDQFWHDAEYHKLLFLKDLFKQNV